MVVNILKERSDVPSISLCICTMNRPDDLSRCLKSVFQSVEKPNEVIISDDSLDSRPTKAVLQQYSSIIYQQGPRQGLGKNRNACISRAKGSHIIFIDDDVCVPPEFFAEARRLVVKYSSQTIITGYEFKYQDGQSHKIVPHNADFWGLQRVAVTCNYQSLVINSTIFPHTLFREAQFDEHLRYGSEEIDMARHATWLGYHITYQDSLYVNHYPSPTNREKYKCYVHASRLYATTKAYWQYERSLPKTLAYLLLAPLQLVGSTAKRGNLTAVWGAMKAIALAYRYLLMTSKSI